VITEIIQKLVERIDLTEEEARAVMDFIMTAGATDSQIAGFLTALRMKGETAAELVGFARAMRDKAEPLWQGEAPAVLDTCGTGGDRSGTFNISTASAFVAAGAGIRIAKHGNRSVTSKCGSADVMEALGVNIQMPVERLRLAIADIGIGFLFAPRFHTSMKYVMPARSQLKIRTVFNMLGPLANPARARFQVVGVYSPAIMELMAGALRGLGLDHVFVVHGADGVDEISISGPTNVMQVYRGVQKSYTITPEDFGVVPAPVETLRGGDAPANATIIEGVLRGDRGPRRDVVRMNAAAAIVAGGVAESLQEGFRLAGESIDSGAALKKLLELRELSINGNG
jgi:anthranilate phosphoribosyltransferase